MFFTLDLIEIKNQGFDIQFEVSLVKTLKIN